MHLNFKLRYFLPSLFYYTSVVFIPCSTKHKLGTNILFCPVLSSPVEVLVVLSQLPNAIWVTVCVVHAYTPYAHMCRKSRCMSFTHMQIDVSQVVQAQELDATWVAGEEWVTSNQTAEMVSVWQLNVHVKLCCN